MFSRIDLSNFKSIREQVSIELSGLTVMTGSNSSGKSTVLQSLLLLSQTLKHSGGDRQMVLNGPLARLGEFGDVLHRPDADQSFGIGLRISPVQSQSRRSDYPGEILRQTPTPDAVEASWQFSDRPVRSEVGAQEGRTFPTVENMRLCSEYQFEENLEKIVLSISRHRWKPETRIDKEGYDDVSETLRNSLAWSVKMIPNPVVDPTAEALGDLRGVVFDHFVPREFSARIDLMHYAASVSLDALAGDLRARNSLDRLLFAESLIKIIRLAVGSPEWMAPLLNEDAVTLESFKSLVAQLPIATRRAFSAKILESRERILREYAKTHETQPFLSSEAAPKSVQKSLRLMRGEISSIRYLGPLRVQPAPLYPVATTLGSEDVGPSGEWTASVLDSYRDKIVEFLVPGDLPTSASEVQPKRDKLINAVNLWVSYLGVSGQVRTEDKGSIGHEITVRSETSSRELPLTHVGVGVSQCLPVVVSMLLAPANTITLLEQPELHLHPAVQSRLADFLLAMSLLNRQCLVETHSEYLVNRLRLRIAESDDEWIRDQVRIYFASIDKGSSFFEEVQVNKYGAVANWPKGFFDNAQDDVEAILRASAKKRKAVRDARRP